MKVTTHFHLVTKLRTSGSKHLSLHTPSWYGHGKFQIFSTACLMPGPQSFPKRVLDRVRSSISTVRVTLQMELITHRTGTRPTRDRINIRFCTQTNTAIQQHAAFKPCVALNETAVINITVFWHKITTRYTSQRVYFYLTTALHVSGVTITHLQEHKTTVTTASGNHYTVLLSAAIVEELVPV